MAFPYRIAFSKLRHAFLEVCCRGKAGFLVKQRTSSDHVWRTLEETNEYSAIDNVLEPLLKWHLDKLKISIDMAIPVCLLCHQLFITCQLLTPMGELQILIQDVALLPS